MSHSTETKWLLDEKYGGMETPQYFDDLRALEAGTPLAYLIGHIPFLGATIYLDSHPLIPRTETEYWVERAILDLKRAEEGVPTRFLDLCAGSGAIGVALLKAFPNSHVDFAEMDPAHHDTIRRNIRENGIDESRARIFGGNLFESIPLCSNSDSGASSEFDAVRGASEARDQRVAIYSAEANTRSNDEMRKLRGCYDAILSNPPYIDPDLSDRVAESVLRHEPHQALFGGASGMELIERILREAPTRLNPGGTLYIEHEPEQTPRIREVSRELGFAAKTHTDQYEEERMTSFHI